MKYVIIGAVAGGASAAARLRRLDEAAEIIIFERGAYISYANCGLPYYIGDVIKDRNKLFVQTAASFERRFNIDVRIKTEVLSIDPANKKVVAFNFETSETYEEYYDKLVLSPGAAPLRPPIPGMHLDGIFTLRTVNDTDLIKDYIQNKKGKKAVVIGGGFIGLEMAENLFHQGLDVTIVEMADQVLTPVDPPIAGMLQHYLRSKGIRLLLSAPVKGFDSDGDRILVSVAGRDPFPADVVVLSIGVKPELQLAQLAGLTIGKSGGIWVNKYLQTSDPHIYAVGDAIEFCHGVSGEPVKTFLAGPANKQGRLVANNLVEGNIHAYDGSVGTAIVKVFDKVIGTTGLSVKQLKAMNRNHATIIIHANSHAGYYPGARLMTIQLAFCPDTGSVLGAQIIGEEGVDKRLDVLSMLIKLKGTVSDLTKFDQAYAPPFSSAKDPLNMAGFVAENFMTGKLKLTGWDVVNDLDENALLLDVRTQSEFFTGSIEGAINIPLDEIRHRLDEIPAGKTIYIFCQQGLRGYIAQSILLQKGYKDVANVVGGYLLYEAMVGS